MIDSMKKERLGVPQVWGPHGPKCHLPTVPTLSLMCLCSLSLTHLTFPLVHCASWDHFLNELLLPLATLKVCFGGNLNHDTHLLKLQELVYIPAGHPPADIMSSGVPTEKHLCQTHPFPCCPLRPIWTHVHIFLHTLGLPGRWFPGFSPCLTPSRPMMLGLDISDKGICQHCKFLVGSCHPVFLVTISLFDCLIRYKSVPKIPSEGARKKSTLGLTWWPMAPLYPQMTNASNKGTCRDKHDKDEAIMQGEYMTLWEEAIVGSYFLS